ncbi:MAG: ankyrin repeat domain-containing protein [Victivallales bacterium]|jgi:ankyrin repeat protein
MKKILEMLLISACLLFSVTLGAEDFDDQKPAKKVRAKNVKVNEAEEAKEPEQATEAAETVEVEEEKQVKEAVPGKKNLHQGLGEDDAFDELLKDIRAGNLEHVDSLLLTFPKLLNRRDKFGQTPVYIAVSANQYPVIEMLVKMNADIKQANTYGDTPLHKAAQTGDIKVLELLLNSGAILWKNNAKGESPLTKAVSAGQVEAVRFLIRNKAELNTPDSKGDTPLHKAAVKGDKAIVKLLLDNGANAGIKNKESLKAADLAKMSEIREMIEACDPAYKR